ncbi:hypothetical protein [Planktothrix serta]|nr:hypothetical protein [Planktothrix serta]
MRNFLIFCLALALVLVGQITHFLMPTELSATEDLGMKKFANLISVESTDSNAVEVDGIRFESLIPQRVLTIPPNRPDAQIPVQLGLRITNQSQKPVRFTRYDTLFPLLLEPNGQRLQLGGGRNWSASPGVSDCPLLQPQESVTFFLDARLFWQDNLLRLEWADGFGGIWFFDDLKPGTYRIALGYSNSSTPVLWAYDPEIKTFRKLTDLWRVPVATPLVEFRLVQR